MALAYSFSNRLSSQAPTAKWIDRDQREGPEEAPKGFPSGYQGPFSKLGLPGTPKGPLGPPGELGNSYCTQGGGGLSGYYKASGGLIKPLKGLLGLIRAL